MLLGCTSLTSELWTGSLWYYKDPSKAPSTKEEAGNPSSGCLTGIDVDNGISEVDFIDQEGKRVSNTP